MSTRQEGVQESVRLSVSTWLTIGGMMAAGIAANLALIYGMAGQIQSRIDKLDLRWQERTLTLTRELKSDIRDVENKIPPEWFRDMVTRNTNEIERLEDEMHRDFVRKGDLKGEGP